MTLKSTNFEGELNKSFTQEEKDLLQPIIRDIKEGNKRKELEELNEEFLQGNLEEYYELLDEEKYFKMSLNENLNYLIIARTKMKKRALRM